MSKSRHHKNTSSINVGELAEALTRNGWQPPTHNPMNGMNHAPGNGSPPGSPGGGNQILNNLGALGSLLGNGMQGMPNQGSSQGIPGMPQMPGQGGMPGMPQMPNQGGMPQMAGMQGMQGMPGMPGMPQMPMGMPGMSPMSPPRPMQQAPPRQQQPLQNQQQQTQADGVSDTELLRRLFQEILTALKEK